MKKTLSVIIASIVLLTATKCYADNFAWGSSFQGSSPSADNIRTNTEDFDNILSAADNTVQDALDTLDNFATGSVPLSFNEISTPTTPSANRVKLYSKDDGSGESALFFLSDAGTETQLGGGGGGGTTVFTGLTDTPGTYVGHSLKTVRVNAGETALEYYTPVVGVSSVFARTGAVVAATNDYTWAQIDKATSNIADITTKSHTSLTDIGTNTHTQIDSHIANTSNPHSVTAAQAGAVALTGNETVAGIKTFSSFPITPSSNPSTDYQVVNKQYVDTLFSTGARFVGNVRAATTAALAANTYNNGASGVGATLTGNANGALAAQDGITLIVGERLLVKNEATAANNGTYSVTQVGDGSNPYILTRTTDYDVSLEIETGTFFTVTEGTTQALQQWAMVTNSVITVGTTSISFGQLSAPPTLTASLGVEKVANDFRADLLANGGLELTGNELRVNVDDSSVELDGTGNVRVKALGVTNAMLAGSIAASKLVGTDITTVGTITSGTWTGTAIGVASGGTNISSYTVGDLLYSSGATTLSKLADVATGNALISGGVATAPSWGKVGLTTHVSGTLPETSGGTNQTTYSTGEILYASGSNTLSKLSPGTSGYVLTMGASVPAWAVATGGGGAGVNSLTYSKSLDTSVSTATISNSAVETTLYTYSVAGGTLSTNKILRVVVSGTYLNNSAANRTVTIRLKYGATTMIAVATGNIATNANTGTFTYTFLLMAHGSTAVQQAYLVGVHETGASAKVVITDGGVAAIDSTATQSLVVTAQLSASTATQTLTKRFATVNMDNGTDTVGSPSDAQYVTLTANGDLTVERVLTGTANRVTLTDNGAGSTVVVNVPDSAQLSVAKLTNLSTNGFVKTGSADGTLSIDTNTYLTAEVDGSTTNELPTAGTYTDVTGTQVDVDATEIEAVTFGAGGNASNIWTFNLSGTDPTITFSSATVTVGGTMTATTVTGANVTSGADPGHTHTSTSISGVDISADTNLTAGDGLTLTDDDIDFDGGAAPAGELGGTWASPTIDDSVTVTGWVMGASTATTPSIDDNDTSLATTAFVNSEISDDLDTSAEILALVTDETGTGSLVFATTPTLVTPVLGVATATTLDTGQGANELYDMDQNVLTTSSPTHADMTLTGGDLIASTATTFNVFDTVATTVNAFGAATTIGIGAATGTLTVDNATTDVKVLDAQSITLNGAITFTDATGYFQNFSGATTWGIYWNTTSNAYEFHNAATVKASLDLDTGDLQIDGDLAVDGANIDTTSNTLTVSANGESILSITNSLLDSVSVDGALTVSSISTFSNLVSITNVVGSGVLYLASTATNDDPVETMIQNRVATTNATVTTIETVDIPASTDVLIEAKVVSRRTGGVSGAAEDGAGYVRYALYKNIGGTATEIAESAAVTLESQSAWNCTISPSGGDAIVTVAGAASNDVTWHSTVRTWYLST